ncbi:AAA family ATPase [Leuconostoc mesenteroides]|uniref:AAA family ATPase n=1 Tax=Leuconostoc mesenteroides TaxID=1245 RepID=UPI0012393AA6|nr:AAA family ATPase [Leuconostoc mesenteroides]KAA8347095.1 DUF2813 domain-containing protein [Leuconostoc mesenteroides]
MFIKKIIIKQFKQLRDIELNLDKKISILAGPNNSGKTSIILLLKRILSDSGTAINPEDFNIYDQVVWQKNFIEFLNLLKEDKTEDFLHIAKQLESSAETLLLPSLVVKLQIDYEDNDDISEFIEYLLDLDPQKHSFYFLYTVKLNIPNFSKQVVEHKDRFIREKPEISLLLEMYCKNCEPHIFFGDSKYEALTEIQDHKKFRSLFNFKYIPAARLLEDNQNKTHIISNGLISYVQKDPQWNKKILDLSAKIYDSISEVNPNEFLQKNAATALNSVMKSISNSNGGHTGEIHLKTILSEDSIMELIRKGTFANYDTKSSHSDSLANYSLNESSQGLGYSNLVYLHTEIESFIRNKNIKLNQTKLSLLIIEEPESHMHPQMQNVFADQLIETYNKENIQGLITTHSTEIVRSVDMSSLKVIRTKTLFNSHVYDLSEFISKQNTALPIKKNDTSTSEVENFKTFFEFIGYADLIFSDIAILFEGDTERLYLQHIINYDSEFDALRKKYIAYTQIGGAYAHKYEKLLEFLEIKSLIITDIDYPKNVDDETTLMASKTTNAAITSFFKNSCDGENIKNQIELGSFFKWLDDSKNIIYSNKLTDITGYTRDNDLIFLSCQTKSDNYTRTLEAAMIAKLFQIKPFQKDTHEKWNERRSDSKLKFSIPQVTKDGPNEISLIDILDATSSAKTDFMFSVILKNKALIMLPDYILKGLRWLMN